MSNIKPNSQFRQNLTVGNTIGERRARGMSSAAPRTIAPTPRHQTDQFSQARGTAQNPGKFSSNADYKSVRRNRVADTPYAKPIPKHIENGTAAQAIKDVNGSGMGPISDDKSLSFLDKIISDKRLWNSKSLKQAYQATARPQYGHGSPKQTVKKAA